MTTTSLRPLSLGELLDRTFFLYRKHFLLFVSIAAIPHLVLLAFQFVGVAINPKGVGFSTVGLLWTFATYVVTLPVAVVAQGGAALAVAKIHLGHETTLSDTLAGIKGRIVSISLIFLGVGIGIGIGLILVLIPGIILAVMWSLTIPVTVLEDTGLSDTTSRSSELTKGSRWRIFLICFLLTALLYIVYVIFETPALLAFGFYLRSHVQVRGAGVPTWFLIVTPLSSFFAQCLAGPLLPITFTLVYYDQKVRKEAFDLQLMMSNLDAPKLDATNLDATPGGTTPATV